MDFRQDDRKLPTRWSHCIKSHFFINKLSENPKSNCSDVMIPPIPPPGRVFANSPDTACVLGLNRKVISFIPVTELKAVTDFE